MEAQSTLGDNRFISTVILWIAIAIALLLSLVYWQERVFTFDNAFQIFLLYINDNIVIMADRWPAVSARFLPYAVLKLGGSLTAVAISFSISYVLFQGAIFYIIHHVLKSRLFSFLFVIVLFFPVSEGFFWCNSEQIHGLSICLLLAALLEDKRNISKKLKITLAIFLSVVIIYFHPLLLFPTFFILVLVQWYNGTLHPSYVVLSILFVLGWFSKRSFDTNWYDEGKKKEFANNLDAWGSRLFEMPAIDTFMAELGTKYLVLGIGFVILLLLSIYYKKWVPLIFSIASTIIFLIVVFLGNPVVENSFYVEINFYTLAIFIFYPILNICFEELSTKLFHTVFCALLLISIGRIVFFASAFTERLAWTSSTLQEQECNKVILSEADYPEGVKMLSWSIPYESILLSQYWTIPKSFHPYKEDYIEGNKYEANLFATEFNILNKEKIALSKLAWPEGEYCLYKHR